MSKAKPVFQASRVDILVRNVERSHLKKMCSFVREKGCEENHVLESRSIVLPSGGSGGGVGSRHVGCIRSWVQIVQG